MWAKPSFSAMNLCFSEIDRFFFFKLNENYHSWRILHTPLWGFFKYSVTKNFSRAREFCSDKQTMSSSCFYTYLIQITNNNKTTKRKIHNQKWAWVTFQTQIVLIPLLSMYHTCSERTALGFTGKRVPLCSFLQWFEAVENDRFCMPVVCSANLLRKSDNNYGRDLWHWEEGNHTCIHVSWMVRFWRTNSLK